MLSLTQAMRLLVPAARTIDFIEALGRTIPIRASSTACATFRDLYVRREHVDEVYREELSPEGMLSIPEVARALRLKQEVAYHLLHVGLLRSVSRHVGRRPARFVELPELKRFQASFAPLVRLAEGSKVAGRQALDWARATGLELVSGPSVDGGRQYFVRVAGSDKTSGDHHE